MTKQTAKRLRAILDSLDDLDPALADFYVQGSGDTEGKYVLGVDDSDGWGVVNASGLHSSLESERKAKAKAERLHKQLERELAAAREQQAALEEQLAAGIPDGAAAEKAIRTKVESEFARKLEAMRAEHEKVLGSTSSQRDAYLAQIRSLMVDSVIGTGDTSKYQFKARLLAPHLKGRIQIEQDEETGQLVRRFLNADGKPGFRGDGTPWDIDDVLTEVSRDPDFGALVTAKNGQPPRQTAAPNRSGLQPPSGRTVRLPQHLLEPGANQAEFERFIEQAEKDGNTVVTS